MVYTDGQWGTKCDDRFVAGGWPSVFCRQLGYDHAVEAKYASEVGLKQRTGHISMHNRDCSPRQSSTMDMCIWGSKKACDHSEDVWVKCERMYANC